MNKQIQSLTATRGVAALMVFIFHMGRHIYPFCMVEGIFTKGNIAVSYFFVLSGFVLYISYVNYPTNYWTYLKKRLGRIAPVYLLALAFSLYKVPFTPDLIWKIVYSFFFLQAFIPKYALVLNTAAWSISAEMFFYVLFPLILTFQKKFNKLFIFVTVAIFVTTQIAYHVLIIHDFNAVENFNFFMFSPVMHIHQFLVGMIGGYIFSRAKLIPRRYTFAPFGLFCIILTCLFFNPAWLFYDAGLYAPLFMLFIVVTALTDPRFLNFKPLIFLGEISYGIYILQFPVYGFLYELNTSSLKLSPQSFFYFSLVVLCITATLTYYLVEKPVRKLLTRSKKSRSIAADNNYVSQ